MKIPDVRLKRGRKSGEQSGIGGHALGDMANAFAAVRRQAGWGIGS